MVGLKALALSCVAAGAAPDGYLIRHVSIVDVDRGVVVADRDVEVVGDRIGRILPGGTGDASLEVIPGEGLYLIPGLFDAHVHISTSPETFGPMLLANGVTCVRDTGAATEFILDLRAQAAAGSKLLPRIVCTGAIIDGDPPIWPFSEACDEPAEARAAVRKLAAAGVDQIKVYSLLAKDVYEAAVDEGHKAGLKVTGHVPVAVTLAEAMAAGQDCCEHLTGFDRALAGIVGWEPPDRSSPWVWFGAWPRMPDATDAQLAAFGRQVRDSGMHQCPTLVVMRGVGRAADPETANADPRLAYVPQGLRAFWGGAQYVAMGKRMGAAVPHMQSMVGHLHRAGVPIMVGTDLANPYVFAGFAVHEEMKLLQEAGMQPADVLRAATVTPAAFCGLGDELGGVQEGKVASLVLLRADPLADIGNASQVEAVFLAGRHFDRGALDAMLADVRSQVQASMPADNVVKLDPPGKVLARGRYVMKFMQYDAGSEDFVITHDQEGYHIMAHSRPQGGPQSPSVVTLDVDEDFAVRRAHWRVLTGERLEATYEAGQGTWTAAAQRAGEPAGEQQIEVPPDALISTPAYASEFAALNRASLTVGQTRELATVGFGFPSWELAVAPYTVTRHDDTTVSRAGAEVAARFYTSELTTDFGTFKGRTWTDADGVVLKSVLTMPFGTITARQEDVAE